MHVVMMVVCKCGGSQFARKPVTAMLVFRSDVLQYMISKSGGAHGFATIHHPHPHPHPPTPTPTPPYKYTHAHTHKYTHTCVRMRTRGAEHFLINE